MLQVPRLDGDDFRSIFERARARIPTLTEEWTNFNPSDPGITTLETFAWLFDTLHYYMNASGEVHRLKYFKLLGIEPRQHRAKCVLALAGGDVDVPRGARVWAGDVPFETLESFRGPANRLTGVYLEQEGRLRDLTGQAGVDGGFADLFGPDCAPGACLYLGFARRLEGRVRLYLELQQTPRNPFGPGFSLAKLAWDAFDGRWTEAEVEEDETCGLLRSGFVTLRLHRASGGPEGMAPGCYVRCRLVENNYDLAPRLGRVLPCCVRAAQVHSWARAEEFVSDGTPVLEPDFWAGENPLTAVFVRGEGEEEYTGWKAPDEAESERVRVEQTASGRLRLHFETPPSPGDRVLVAALSPGAARMAHLGRTDGCAGQRLDIDAENLSALTLALLRTEPDGRVRCQLWTQCPDLAEAGWDDRVFQLDESRRQVVFGDSLHGRQPQAGWDVLAVQVCTSRFEGGNVVADSVTRPETPLPGVTAVYNPAPAAGGCRCKTAAQLQAELDALWQTPARAVTEEDYRAIALATPGLLVDSVAVIPMETYSARYGTPFVSNTVVVAVKPRTGGRLPRLSEAYCRAVQAQLERCRVLTTDIRVVEARYVGVSVYGRVRLRPGRTGGAARVEEVIRRAVETLDSGAYGRGVDCGRLFSALELEECVQGVEQLSLEYIGRGGGKNEHGDITAGPDCLTYLKEIGIEYM